jgi:hypothetical protein
MIWGIIFDVLLWVATVVLLILSYTTPSFTLFLLGALCFLLAIILLCILVGGESGGSSGVSFLDDVFDSID